MSYDEVCASVYIHVCKPYREAVFALTINHQTLLRDYHYSLLRAALASFPPALCAHARNFTRHRRTELGCLGSEVITTAWSICGASTSSSRASEIMIVHKRQSRLANRLAKIHLVARVACLYRHRLIGGLLSAQS